MGETLWFDDLVPGTRATSGPFVVDADGMLDFSTQWDPLPIHVDREFAARSVHGSLIASGIYTLAVKQYLLARHVPWRDAVIGAAGYDEVRFPVPVRAGDRLSFTWEVEDARPSRSKPDRGIVRFRNALSNERGEVVLSYIDTVVIARRAPA